MKNIEWKVEKDKLILTIDVSNKARKDAKPSKSGKTKVIASTEGNKSMGDVTVGLNVYFK